MGVDDLSLEAYRAADARADREARFELRWVAALEYAASVAVTLGASLDDFGDTAKKAFRRADRALADTKRAMMKQMAANTTTRRKT